MRSTPSNSSHKHRCFFTPSVWSHLHVIEIAAAKYPSSVFTCFFLCSCLTIDGQHEKCLPPHQSVSPSFNYRVVHANRLWKGGLFSLCIPLSLNEKSCPWYVLCSVGVTLRLSPLSGIPLKEELAEKRSPEFSRITQLSACPFIKPAFVLTHNVCLASVSAAECGILH